jgi:homoaconitate hydratase
LVLAGSLSETYKRNAINNGFLVLEAPELVADLKQRFGATQLTVRTGLPASVDFTKALIVVDGREYPLSPVGAAAQELILTGGLEAWVKGQLT